MPARFGVAFMGTGQGAAVKCFVELVHFHDLVFDMGGLVGAVILGDGLGGPDEHIAHAHLAGVALAVVGGELFYQRAGEFAYSLYMKTRSQGDEDVVEDHQDFMTAVVEVTQVDGVAFGAAGVARLAPHDVGDAGLVGRNVERDTA